MKRFAFGAVALAAMISGAHGQDAFGLALGEPVADLALLPKTGEKTREVASVPAPFDGFDGYIVSVGRDNILCNVRAVLAFSDPGSAESLSRRVRYALSDVYSEPRHISRPYGKASNVSELWEWKTDDRLMVLTKRVSDTGFDRAVVFHIEPRRALAACIETSNLTKFEKPVWQRLLGF